MCLHVLRFFCVFCVLCCTFSILRGVFFDQGWGVQSQVGFGYAWFVFHGLAFVWCWFFSRALMTCFFACALLCFFSQEERDADRDQASGGEETKASDCLPPPPPGGLAKGGEDEVPGQDDRRQQGNEGGGSRLSPSPEVLAGAGEPDLKEGEGERDVEEAAPCPLPRINPCLTVRGNTLYVYGGLLEVRACTEVHACVLVCFL